MNRFIPAYLLILALLLPACASSPLAPWHEGLAVQPEVAAIHRLGQRLDRAWDQRDADAFAALFLRSGDFQFPSGKLLQGQDEIREYYRTTAFPSFEADLLHQTTPLRIRFLSADAALADGVVHFVHANATRPEDRLHLTLHVTSALARRHGKWSIAAVRLMEFEAQ